MQLTAASCPTKDLLSAPDLASNARAIESPQAVHTRGKEMGETIGLGIVKQGVQEQQAVCKQLTDAGVELHGDDGALVALVLPRAVAELSDPALGRPVRGPAVHEPVYHQDADHRVRVPVHRLVRGRALHKS